MLTNLTKEVGSGPDCAPVTLTSRALSLEPQASGPAFPLPPQRFAYGGRTSDLGPRTTDYGQRTTVNDEAAQRLLSAEVFDDRLERFDDFGLVDA